MNSSTKPNANFRRDSIPVWINVLVVIVALILLFQGISAYLNPQWYYAGFDASTTANSQAMTLLAGRNITMFLLVLAALRSQNAMFLAFIILMGIFREGQDMFIVPYYLGFGTMAGISTFFSFFLFMVPYVLAIKKLRKIAAAN